MGGNCYNYGWKETSNGWKYMLLALAGKHCQKACIYGGTQDLESSSSQLCAHALCGVDLILISAAHSDCLHLSDNAIHSLVHVIESYWILPDDKQ